MAHVLVAVNTVLLIALLIAHGVTFSTLKKNARGLFK